MSGLESARSDDGGRIQSYACCNGQETRVGNESLGTGFWQRGCCPWLFSCGLGARFNRQSWADYAVQSRFSAFRGLIVAVRALNRHNSMQVLRGGDKAGHWSHAGILGGRNGGVDA